VFFLTKASLFVTRLAILCVFVYHLVVVVIWLPGKTRLCNGLYCVGRYELYSLTHVIRNHQPDADAVPIIDQGTSCYHTVLDNMFHCLP